MLTDFNFSFRRVSDDLPLNQHEIDKGYSWKIE